MGADDRQPGPPAPAAPPRAAPAVAAATAAAESSEFFVALRAGTLWLALPAEGVEEISGRTPATPVPLMPPHIPGVVNLRGHALPLLDLECFLGLPREEKPDDVAFGRMVIVASAGMRVGVLCDQVLGVIEAPHPRRRQPTVTQGQRLGEFALCEVDHGGHLVVVVDEQKLLRAARVAR